MKWTVSDLVVVQSAAIGPTVCRVEQVASVDELPEIDSVEMPVEEVRALLHETNVVRLILLDMVGYTMPHYFYVFEQTDSRFVDLQGVELFISPIGGATRLQ